MTPSPEYVEQARKLCYFHRAFETTVDSLLYCNCRDIASALQAADDRATERACKAVCQWCAGGEMENAVVLPVNEQGRHPGKWTRGCGVFDLGCAATPIRERVKEQGR